MPLFSLSPTFPQKVSTMFPDQTVNDVAGPYHWRSALLIVKPETVVAWHRKGFRVVVFGERSLRRTLTSYCAYYHQWRTQLSLDKAVPQSRKRQRPAKGPVIEVPEVGGLHHHYERQAA
jgi:hypothetical protein